MYRLLFSWEGKLYPPTHTDSAPCAFEELYRLRTGTYGLGSEQRAHVDFAIAAPRDVAENAPALRARRGSDPLLTVPPQATSCIGSRVWSFRLHLVGILNFNALPFSVCGGSHAHGGHVLRAGAVRRGLYEAPVMLSAISQACVLCAKFEAVMNHTALRGTTQMG